MRVLYFLFDGFDTANGTNHLALTTMHTLIDKGIDVHLVTSHSKGLFPDIPDSIKNREGFSYTIIQRKNVNKRNFVQRYIDGMIYAFKAFKECKKQDKSLDIVILQSTPTAFFSAFFIHSCLKIPYIYNNFDVFPDGPYLFGAIRNKLMYKVLSCFQNYVYKNSNRIVVISDDMKNTFVKKGIDETKLVTIPNWYDSDAVKEVQESDNEFVKKYDIDSRKFIVQYAGNIGYTFNYHAFIEIAKILRENTNIEFHIIGMGGFEKDFKEMAQKEKLSNIVFFPWQDSSVISDVYSSCDIELVPLSKGVIWTSFPSKCTLLMACGRSFICLCEDNSHFSKMVNEQKIGICVDRTDYNRAAESIMSLYNNKSLLLEMDTNAKLYGERVYSSASNAYKYVDAILEIMEGK